MNIRWLYPTLLAGWAVWVCGCSGLLGADFDHPAATDASGSSDAYGSSDVAVAADSPPHDAGSPVDGSTTRCDACDVAPACGGYGQPCCQNSSCGPGLVCLSTGCAGKVLMVGGQGATNYLNDAWEWDGTSWQSVPSGPPTAAWAMAASLGGKVYVFGGFSASSVGAMDGTDWDSLYAWDGVAWTQLSPKTMPPARNNGFMQFDGTELVLFGGLGADTLGDTWTFDGGGWNDWSSLTNRPGPRYGACGGLLDGGVVMFGGYQNLADGGGRQLGSTWQWTGSGWNGLKPDGGPSARSGGAAAIYKGKLIMVGGEDDTTIFDEVWSWDGSSWTQGPDAGIGGIVSPGLAEFDGKLVLFGGNDANNLPTANTWLYDGSTWTKSAATGPSARNGPVMVAR
jgi:hypothetical protein